MILVFISIVNDRFGSLAALLTNISLMSGFEGKADVFRFNFGSLRFNVRFSQERTLLPRRNSNFQGPLSATSGRAVLKLATTYEGHDRSVIAES